MQTRFVERVPFQDVGICTGWTAVLSDPSASGGIRAADRRSLVSRGENSQTPSFRLGLPNCRQGVRSISEEPDDSAKMIERLFAIDRCAKWKRGIPGI